MWNFYTILPVVRFPHRLGFFNVRKPTCPRGFVPSEELDAGPTDIVAKERGQMVAAREADIEPVHPQFMECLNTTMKRSRDPSFGILTNT